MIRKMQRFNGKIRALRALVNTLANRKFAANFGSAVSRVLLLVLLTLPALAQPGDGGPEMADTLRGDGKFWVVVVTIALVTAGMFAYMIRLEGKVRRLEERVGRRADGFIER
jgi:hypothetical protein